MLRNFIFGSLIIIMMSSILTACGKRGDPYRPSEIPVKNQVQTPVN